MKVLCDDKIFPSFYFQEDKNHVYNKVGKKVSIIWDSLSTNKHNSEFVFINCGKNSIYPFLKVKKNITVIERLKSFPKKDIESNKPFNVIILSLDTISRQSFIKNFNKTLSLFKNLDLDSEYFVYDFKKASTPDVLHSNIFMQSFYGISIRSHIDYVNQYTKIGIEREDVLQSNQRKSLWSQFYFNGFATLYLNTQTEIEYIVGKNVFADHNIGSFWNLGDSLFYNSELISDCYGNTTSINLALKYSSEFFDVYKNQDKFMFIHLEKKTSGITNYQLIDRNIESFISQVLTQKSGTQSRTVLILTSNKGENFEELEWNPKSFFMNMNPLTYIIASKDFINKYSNHTILKHNSDIILSKRYLYHSISSLSNYPDIHNVDNFIKQDKLLIRVENIFTRYLNKLKCRDIYLSDEFCLCNNFKTVDLESKNQQTVVTQIALLAKNSLEKERNFDCIENFEFKVKDAKSFTFKTIEKGGDRLYEIDCSNDKVKSCSILAVFRVKTSKIKPKYSDEFILNYKKLEIILISVKGKKECLDIGFYKDF